MNIPHNMVHDVNGMLGIVLNGTQSFVSSINEDKEFTAELVKAIKLAIEKINEIGSVEAVTINSFIEIS